MPLLPFLLVIPATRGLPLAPTRHLQNTLCLPRIDQGHLKTLQGTYCNQSAMSTLSAFISLALIWFQNVALAADMLAEKCMLAGLTYLRHSLFWRILKSNRLI